MFLGIIIPIFIIIICSIILWKKCAKFDIASRIIGQNLNSGIRGATINAIASSLPEFFVALFFLFYFSNDITGFLGTIGTIFGSAIFNILIIPAIVIFIMIYYRKETAIINKKIIIRDAIPLIISQILLIVSLADKEITLHESFSFIFIYLAYIIYLFNSNKNKNTATKHNTKGAWVRLILNTTYIGIACFFLVQACEWIGRDEYTLFSLTLYGLKMSPLYVALIFAAAASSVPDALISATDAMKGDVEDSLANPIASNTFDICIALGLPLTLYILFYGPINLNLMENPNSVIDIMYYMLFLTLSVIFLLVSFKKYNLFQGVSFVVLYIVFLVLIFI